MPAVAGAGGVELIRTIRKTDSSCGWTTPRCCRIATRDLRFHSFCFLTATFPTGNVIVSSLKNDQADRLSETSGGTTSIRFDSPIDFPQLLHRCLGNERLAREVIVRFHDRIEEDVARLQGALRRQDTTELAAVAHRIKGAAASLSANRLTEAASGMEEGARAGHLQQVSHWLQRFKSEGKALSRYVTGTRDAGFTRGK